MNSREPISLLRGFLSFIYRISDLSVIFVLLFTFVGNPNVELLEQPLTLFVGGLAALSYMVSAESFDLYGSFRTSRFQKLISVTVISWMIAVAVVATTGFFGALAITTYAPELLLWAFAVLGGLTGWRVLYELILVGAHRIGLNSRSVAIIGVTPSGLQMRDELTKNPQKGLNFVGFFDDRDLERIDPEYRNLVIDGVDGAIAMAKQSQIDILFIAMPMKAEERIAEILHKCSDTAASVHIIPDFFVYNMLNARWHEVGNAQTLSIYETPHFGLNSWLKRIEDLVLSSAILAFVLLPMIFISLLIKLSSKGPILNVQDRYGLDGRRVRVLKFRTTTNATTQPNQLTSVGRFLQRTSLDDLPQLFNVLAGTMSLVGPRPFTEVHSEQYRSVISRYMLRHRVKPGVMGVAAMNKAHHEEMDSIDNMQVRVESDLNYIRNWSVIFDIKIIFLSLFKVVVGKNAY